MPTNKTIINALPDKQELFITREFDAPRDLVFKAFTDPDLYVQWLGPLGYSMKLETFEPISGGRWRYFHKDLEGNNFAFHGVYHEVKPAERIISTFEYEGWPESGHVMFETVKFESLPGNRTKITTQSVFKSVADRDEMIQSGMEHGVVDSHQKLDEILVKLQG
jgi:uncharacterized protein YndB with AHSA1/START domain